MRELVDDEEYPFAEWAGDYDVRPDEYCPSCAGEGWVSTGTPCPCWILEAFRIYPAATDLAVADPDCERCGGDGETPGGHLCICLLPSFRTAHETITWT